jgi:hypothetical protein
MKDETPIITDSNQPYAIVSTDGALMVEGIENWILGLVPLQETDKDSSVPEMIRLMDPKTKAVFLVSRISN